MDVAMAPYLPARSPTWQAWGVEALQAGEAPWWKGSRWPRVELQAEVPLVPLAGAVWMW